MKNQSKFSAILAIAAFLTGCASGGGSGEERAPEPYEPRTRFIPGNCGLYALLDIYGACTPSREERVTKQFKDWAGVAANAGFLYQYDSIDQGYGVAIPEYESNRTLVRDSSHAENLYATFAQIGQPWVDVVYRGGGDTQLYANPYALGWNYQSFGVWGSNRPSASVGASTYGAATPVSAVPTSGNATFTGKLAGYYVPPTGAVATATADLTVSANFSTRSLNFASRGTSTAPASTWLTASNRVTATPAPHLDLNGTLTYQPGANSFQGKLTNAAGTMTGSSRGQFYGPAAQELGGVFSVKASSGTETFTGAYGAKR